MCVCVAFVLVSGGWMDLVDVFANSFWCRRNLYLSSRHILSHFFSGASNKINYISRGLLVE